MVFSKRFCTAPRSARWESIILIAWSMTSTASWEFCTVVTSMSEILSSVTAVAAV
ncbi:hypothetical protein D3C80_2092760 [compost metagenome]